MKRKIIQIDEAKCNGCTKCIGICAEAALEMVDGKAKLIREFYCDGMGACLDVCPTGALEVVEKESEEYNVKKTFEHVKKERGEEHAQKVHGAEELNSEEAAGKPFSCECPGSMTRDLREESTGKSMPEAVSGKSELRQWPIQLHLISPEAPYFENADLVISADCVPFAHPNFHARFLQGKAMVMFCPKLDSNQEIYLEKLTHIFQTQNINSITTVHMEVPCCGGVGHLVEEALKHSGKNIIIKEYIISIQGEIV